MRKAVLILAIIAAICAAEDWENWKPFSPCHAYGSGTDSVFVATPCKLDTAIKRAQEWADYFAPGKKAEWQSYDGKQWHFALIPN